MKEELQIAPSKRNKNQFFSFKIFSKI